MRHSDKTTIRGKKRFFPSRISSIINKVGTMRGTVNEDLVEPILEELKRDGEIKSFFRTQHKSSLDKSGIDFVIILNDNERIGIDVKSSLRNVEKFLAEKEKKGVNRWNIEPFPLCVSTEHLQNPELLKTNIREIIQRCSE